MVQLVAPQNSAKRTPSATALAMTSTHVLLGESPVPNAATARVVIAMRLAFGFDGEFDGEI